MDTSPLPNEVPEIQAPAPADEQKENRFWEHSKGRGSVGLRQQLTYDMVIDFLLANPRASRQEIATAFGYTSLQSISVMLNSDAFQARMAKRREQMVDPVIAASIDDRIKGLASRSAEILAEKLEQNPSEKLVMEVFKESTRAGGYGAAVKIPVQNASFIVNMPGPAASTKEWRDRFAPAEATVVEPRYLDAPSEKPAD